jgi:nitroimidazol reductase NimA-like FMN-containing flavoprotein (pyridoxamine 5'-phosphate oxidase superfamily)
MTEPVSPPSTSAPQPTDRFAVTSLNRVRRLHERARYDRDTVYGILDRGLVAHVTFVNEGRHVVVPMTYGRDGDRLFLHGARKARITTTPVGEPVCIAVTLLDGLVVARSLFDSSMNYRAVVVHGRAVELHDDAERLYALRCISEHLLPGRWEEVGAPSAQQLKATAVLAVEIESASAKIRDGGVKEDVTSENAERVWAGVIPFITRAGAPETDPSVPAGVEIPPSVRRVCAW